MGLFCEEAEGKAPSEPRRRSRDSVSKRCITLQSFQLFTGNISKAVRLLVNKEEEAVTHSQKGAKDYRVFSSVTGILVKP